MSDRPSFLDELRAADPVGGSERLRPGAVHRISRRIDAELLQSEVPSRRRTLIPMVSFAAGAALVLAVFTWGGGSDTAQRVIEAEVPMHASWQVGGTNCHATRGEAELVLDGHCRVQTSEPGLVIESRKTTRMHAIDHGVKLSHGVALFEVEPTTKGNPWRVEVPGGAIEVVGTRFSVVVSGDRGHVDLLEGSIRFVASDGRVHAVEPGERFRFSAGNAAMAAASPTEPAPPEPPLAAGERLSAVEAAHAAETSGDPQAPLAAGERLAALGRSGREGKTTPRTRAVGGTEDLEAVVAEVTRLRSQRQYRAAVTLLRDTLRQGWDRHPREVLSYELGTILSTQLADQKAACAHWAEHLQRFPDGRYDKAIERARERLACP